MADPLTTVTIDEVRVRSARHCGGVVIGLENCREQRHESAPGSPRRPLLVQRPRRGARTPRDDAVDVARRILLTHPSYARSGRGEPHRRDLPHCGDRHRGHERSASTDCWLLADEMRTRRATRLPVGRRDHEVRIARVWPLAGPPTTTAGRGAAPTVRGAAVESISRCQRSSRCVGHRPKR